MKADLPQREPDRVRWWKEERVYERRLAKNAHESPWILHDGPPYANGEVHMGTFLNRVVKDVFVKVHLLDGRYAKFVPGWDMHGLPIEFETLKHLGLDFRRVDPIELRAKCRERALYWLDVQRATFLRMGLLGDFDHPYRTIDAEFEAVIVETLAELAEAEQLYKGLRSTLWCIHDETALAEAEIEYKDKVSPSIYVRFRANEAQRAELLEKLSVDPRSVEGLPLSVLIWTTTPWTLPANVAIALKPEAAYGCYRRGDELLVLADALSAAVFARAPGPPATRVGGALGTGLVGAKVRHPFLDRDSLVVGADYVELDTGTGAVHTAPGHGVDDFNTGMRFGLPIESPVNASGHFTAGAGPYVGLQIFAANATIAADLEASGHLFAREEYQHSYPHCWRCHNPVIFRATSQWFIALDVNRLRKRIEEKIPTVKWYPAWGENRMLQTIENHPEWCISRQRTWGTPIPAVACEQCGESFIDPDLARNAARLFREAANTETNASDVWWTRSLETFAPPGLACPKCRSTALRKEFNIVDIWFESGVTHKAVLRQRGLGWPADLYLEGSDQFRGWFRSNLVTAVATNGAPPYRGVVATGWVVDADGRAMHKSTGNYIAAQEAMEKYGADVLRLWCASVEFTADMRLGEALLKNVGSVYRNFRYRLRYLLGLIDDLRTEDLVPREQMEPIDRLALVATEEMARKALGHYRTYALHDVYLALVDFDANDLSRFYIDGVKDRAYTSARTAQRRRSGQTAAFTILRTLLALLAPILSFTAEEAWQAVPEPLRGDDRSVFDLRMPRAAARTPHDDESLALWATLKELRAVVAASETERDFQLQALVSANAADAARLHGLGDNLREALIVSQLAVEIDESATDPRVTVRSATGAKCARCWKYLHLGADPLHPTLCAPCATIVRGFDGPSA